MQGLADGYFVLPYTIGDYLATAKLDEGRRRRIRSAARRRSDGAEPDQAAARDQGQADGGFVPPRAGQAHVGPLRHGAERGGPEGGARSAFPTLREEFWRNVNVPGSDEELNQALEKAGRVADFLELAELMCRDALHREESCGGHFREEYQTRGRRGAARRRAVRLRRGLGVRRARTRRRGCTRSRSSSSTCSSPSGATSECDSIASRCWRPAPAPATRTGPDGRDYEAPRHQPRHVVPRDARRRERAA